MQRYRYIWFMLSLTISFLVAPITETTTIGQVAISFWLTIIVLFGVNTSTDNRWHLILALVLGSLWLLTAWAYVVLQTVFLEVVSGIIFFLLLVALIYDIMVLLMKVRETDYNVLSAAISVYLLLGLAWAMSYDVIEILFPGSYGRLDPAQPMWSDFLYFSLTTLTTLGYGDMTPLTALAGIWSTFEAVLGQLYVAVLIARLIGLIRN